jgi:hypothetical protein
MDLDLISVMLGAGLALFGVITGAPVVLLLRHRAPAREPDPYTCGCTHALAVHDPETNRCNAAVEVQLYNTLNQPAGRKAAPCPCRQYVGERPVDVEAVLDDFVKKHPLPLIEQDQA